MTSKQTVGQTSVEPSAFWSHCEDEYDRSVGRAVEYLACQATRLSKISSALGGLDSFLIPHAMREPAGLQRLLQSYDESLLQIEQGKCEILAAQVSPALPGTYIAAEADLRQLLDQLIARLKATLEPLSSQLTDEADRWLESRKHATVEKSQKESDLAKNAENLMASMKEVSNRTLFQTAEDVRRLEAQFEAEKEAARNSIPPKEPGSPVPGFLLLAAALACLIGGLWITGTSVVFGGGIAILGAALGLVGIVRLRALRNKSSSPATPCTPDAAELRRKVRVISEAAEKTASGQVVKIKSQLQLVKAELDALPAKEREATNAVDNLAKKNIEGLRVSNVDRVAKLVEGLKAVSQQWAKLAQQAENGMVADWKRGIEAQVVALNSAANAAPQPAAKVSVELALGQTKHNPPAKLRPHIGHLSLTVPFYLSFEGAVLGVRAKDTNAQDQTSAVCIKLLLELAVVSHGKLRTRLWDPRYLGANYGQLLELAHTKDTFVDQGRALTANLELEETLTNLQKLTADRMAFLAKRKLSSWLEVVGDSPTSTDDLEVLVAVGFPFGFSESTIATLQSIGISGARCGIFVLLDLAPVADTDSIREQVRREATKLMNGAPVIQVVDGDLVCYGDSSISVRLRDLALSQRATLSLHSSCQVTDQEQTQPAIIAPLGDVTFENFRQLVAANKGWTEKSKDGLEIQLGLGFNDQVSQNLRFDNTTSHALLLGGTGSGKSNLLHSLIQGIALDYSPLEVCFYLADLKDGVEFARYTQPGRLPHAAAIAATADPRYAVALVKAAAEELTRRNKIFISAECANFEKYRSIPHVSLPRILVIIDEFQVLFEDRESSLAMKSALINLCKKGRSAGIHLLLASQSLKGKAGDIDEVLGLIQTRILMKISEGDARRAVSDSAMATRVAEKCTKRGLGCVDSEFGAGAERYFRNPFVDENDYFFKLIRHYSQSDGSAICLDEEPVIWKDEPRQLQANPQYSRLEQESRQILIGEPYSIEHAIGFRFSETHTECVAVASASATQQMSIISSILASAAKTCSKTIRTTIIRSSDAVLHFKNIEALLSSKSVEIKTCEMPHISQALSDCRADFLPDAAVDSAELHILVILGSADLTVPKRSAFGSSSTEKAASLSDIEAIGELLAIDTNGRLQIVIACRSPLSFMDQLAPIKDRIGIKIFGPANAGSRLRDFVGQSELSDLKPHDMGIYRSGDLGVSIFKPFGTAIEVS